MDEFAKAWAATGPVEGGYSNDPADAGGETNHGITARVARAHGYSGPMKDLPTATALSIARAAYWDPLRLDEIGRLSGRIARELFDSAFNIGLTYPASWLQEALNALNDGGSDYADQVVDGHVGTMTIDALGKFLKRRGVAGEVVMLRCLDGQQACYYLALTRAKPIDERFFYGWVLNRVGLDWTAPVRV